MNIKDLITEVRAHDARATIGPWHPQHGAIRVDLPGPVEYTWALSAYPKDVALIANYRTAAPLLADEVERLNAENATLRSNLQSIEHALADRRKPGETLEWTIAEMFADLDRAEHERTAIRAANEELRLTLAAEQGLSKGAPSPVWRHQGQGTWHNVNTGSVVRRGGWPVTMPGESTWTRPNGTHGTAENARAAMKAADAA